MKTVGIIAEYNPFHNGHKYQIEQARKITGADYCIVVMSGNFVQRGEPAVFDKYTRTKMALSEGADLVFELPVCFATSSAELFAASAVSLLDHLGCTDFLCFGSECGSLPQLSAIADILSQEPVPFRSCLQDLLRQGHTYPEAMSKAYEYYAKNLYSGETEVSFDQSLFTEPNNLLAIEYLKTCKRRNSSIIPITIPRKGQAYHATQADEPFSSASAIRNSIASGADNVQLSKWIPASALSQIRCKQALQADDFSALLDTFRIYEKDYARYAGISHDFSNRLLSFSLTPMTFSDLARKIKTRQYTYSYISRGLLHLLLQIKKEDIELGKSSDYTPYLRILGVRKDATYLLRRIKAHTDLPLINKLADAAPNRLLELDIQAAHLYRSVLYHKTGHLLPDEYRAGICIL